jgi:site-specific DNA-methyltransferase (adenine-specific)
MTPKTAQTILKAMKYCKESERKDFILNYANMNNKIENKVYNMDCIEGMKMYPDKYFDLAVVDPPYGIGENGQRNVTGDRPTEKWKNPKSQHYKTFDDSQIPTEDYFKELFRVSKNQIVFGGNYFTEYLPPSKGWIVWDKQADIKEHLSMCELAWSSFDKKCNKYEYLWAGFKKKHQVERIHPTQKPVDLYRWVLQYYAEKGMKILDTHLGSGSSRIAAYKGGFNFVGFEIDSDYYNASIKRYELAIQQQTLF